jgi:hypothetical protein
MASKWAAVAAVVALAGCAPPPERLTIQGRVLTVLNDTSSEWRSVEIWVNDHYRVTRAAIAPGERFSAPLDVFVEGFGRRFARNQQVTGIEVTATSASGERIRIVWGEGRRR